MTSPYNISKSDFLALSKVGQVVPVFVKVFGGTDTPVGIYEKLSAGLGTVSSGFPVEPVSLRQILNL